MDRREIIAIGGGGLSAENPLLERFIAGRVKKIAPTE
jgi:hypothetical protein